MINSLRIEAGRERPQVGRVDAQPLMRAVIVCVSQGGKDIINVEVRISVSVKHHFNRRLPVVESEMGWFGGLSGLHWMSMVR